MLGGRLGRVKQMSLFKVKKLEGKRVREIVSGRVGIVVKHKKDGRLTIVFDDKPGVKNMGFLDEEFEFA